MQVLQKKFNLATHAAFIDVNNPAGVDGVRNYNKHDTI